MDWIERLGIITDLVKIALSGLILAGAWIVLWLWPTRWLLDLIYSLDDDRGRSRLLSRVLRRAFPVEKAAVRYTGRWIRSRLPQVRRRFEAHYESASKDYPAFVPGMVRLPGTVSFDEHSEVKAEPAELKRLFRDRGIPILISGDGGIGKTSLAMQMCRWAMDDKDPLSTVGPMIPVFFQATQPLSDRLLDDISHQLRTLVGGEELREWLVKALLASGRILVVIDDISERLPPPSTQAIYRAQQDLPISAMIVTRRHDDPDLVPRKHIEVREFRADQIRSFLETYFKERNVALPAAATLGELAARFGELTDRHTNSAFFLKLFCDQMIDSNFAATRCNLATLVRSYLMRVNRHRRGNEPDDEGVYRLYGAFACTALEANEFGTGPISRRAAAAALGDEPAALDYLTTRLRLVSPDEDDRGQLRCTTPTLGLYVAAMTYADRCGSSIEQWEGLIGRVASAKESGTGLAIALHHVLSTVQGASPKVRERIAAIAGLDLPLDGEAIPGTDYVVGHELPNRVPQVSNVIRFACTRCTVPEIRRAGHAASDTT